MRPFLFVLWLAQPIKQLGDIRLDPLTSALPSLGSVAPTRYPIANSVSTSKANNDRAQDRKKFSDEAKHLKQSYYSEQLEAQEASPGCRYTESQNYDGDRQDLHDAVLLATYFHCALKLRLHRHSKPNSIFGGARHSLLL
jgi:hypothetical protein